MRAIDAEVLLKSFVDTLQKCREWIDNAKDEEIRIVAEANYAEFLESTLRVEHAPTIDAVEIVRCRDCRWYTLPHIRFNNGEKEFFTNEKDMPMVTADVGTMVGGQCIGHKTYCTAHNREDPDDYENLVIFRNTNDFCSYAVRK